MRPPRVVAYRISVSSSCDPMSEATQHLNWFMIFPFELKYNDQREPTPLVPGHYPGFQNLLRLTQKGCRFT
jgi:hypothetical protein